MTFDEIIEQLKHLEPDIAVITSFCTKKQLEEALNRLEKLSQEADFWKNPDQAVISKELQTVRPLYEQYISIVSTYQDLKELVTLFCDNQEEIEKLVPDVIDLKKKIEQFKINLFLSEPSDASSCFLHIHAGAGGTESQDWALMLLRMYTRFCERNFLPFDIIDYIAGEEAGIKSATLFIKGKNPYGLLKSEHGVHRLVRISPFDANKRRHTSFASVLLTPEVPEVEVSIDLNDLRIDTYRASGAGGQHVNKTDSAVRITHLPTNIVVQCQKERSQQQNKAFAMKMLHAKLAQKIKEEQDAQTNALVDKKKIEWGSQIRSYVLHPYKLIKDHRTDFESPQPDKVLDGELMEFIKAYLIWYNETKQ